MEITNKTKLQELINYIGTLIEEDEPIDAEKCPNLDECQYELNRIEIICMNYLLSK